MDSSIWNLLGVMVSIGLAATIPIGAVMLFKALASRLERRPELPENELESIRARLEDVDELKARIVELEERVDFSERMLAQHEQFRQLNP